MMSSATKLVLVLLSFDLCILVSAIVFTNLGNDKITLPIVLLFSNAVVAVIAFYFGQKGTQPQITSQNIETVDNSSTITPNE